MGRFNSDRGGSGGGRDRSSGGRRSERPEMHEAVCDECGKDCRVPFRPSGDKPIYCSDCFEKMGNVSPRRDSRDSRGSSSRDYRDDGMFSAVCDDCGRDCQVPFRPTGEKPIYCSRCFEKRGNTHDNESNDRGSRNNSRGGNSEGNRTLENSILMLNEKLDKIITLLEVKKEVKVRAIRKPKEVILAEVKELEPESTDIS